MARHTLFVALLLATATVHAISAKPALFETFSQGWEDRWQHSDSDKYGGEFEVDTPDGLDDPALKVRCIFDQQPTRSLLLPPSAPQHPTRHRTLGAQQGTVLWHFWFVEQTN